MSTSDHRVIIGPSSNRINIANLKTIIRETTQEQIITEKPVILTNNNKISLDVDSINSYHLADSAVNNSKIADNSIRPEKLSKPSDSNGLQNGNIKILYYNGLNWDYGDPIDLNLTSDSRSIITNSNETSLTLENNYINLSGALLETNKSTGNKAAVLDIKENAIKSKNAKYFFPQLDKQSNESNLDLVGKSLIVTDVKYDVDSTDEYNKLIPNIYLGFAL
jgi:hypothetical protein